MLDDIKSDERLNYAPATIDINVPLALIQLSLEVKRDLLIWVLE